VLPGIGGGPVSKLPQPGWYPDPAGMPTRQYWEGRQWTNLAPSTPPPKKLPAAVREKILTDELDAHIAGNTTVAQGMVRRDSTGTAIPNDGGALQAGDTVHPVFEQRCYVKIREREPLSAIVYNGNYYAPNGGLTYPTTIVKCMVLSFVTVGFFLPLWWWLLGKKVPEFTWSVDEYGVVSRTQNAIPEAQRTLRWIVLGVTVGWALLMIAGAISGT
jgi:hypothetical protein